MLMHKVKKLTALTAIKLKYQLSRDTHLLVEVDPSSESSAWKRRTHKRSADWTAALSSLIEVLCMAVSGSFSNPPYSIEITCEDMLFATCRLKMKCFDTTHSYMRRAYSNIQSQHAVKILSLIHI